MAVFPKFISPFKSREVVKINSSIWVIAFSLFCFASVSNGDQRRATEWSPYQLVKQASHVVIGRVDYVPDVDIAGYRVLKIMPREVLHGSLDSLNEDIFIISPGPVDGLVNAPAVFFPTEYLLFLKPVQNTLWNKISEKVQSHALTEDRVFEVVNFWQGAVSLNESVKERSNHAIAAQFDIKNPTEISEGIKDIYHALSKEKSSSETGIRFLKRGENKIVEAFQKDFLRKPFTLPR